MALQRSEYLPRLCEESNCPLERNPLKIRLISNGLILNEPVYSNIYTLQYFIASRLHVDLLEKYSSVANYIYHICRPCVFSLTKSPFCVLDFELLGARFYLLK